MSFFSLGILFSVAIVAWEKSIQASVGYGSGWRAAASKDGGSVVLVVLVVLDQAIVAILATRQGLVRQYNPTPKLSAKIVRVVAILACEK